MKFIADNPPRKFAQKPHKIRAKASFKSNKLCVEIYAQYADKTIHTNCVKIFHAKHIQNILTNCVKIFHAKYIQNHHINC